MQTTSKVLLFALIAIITITCSNRKTYQIFSPDKNLKGEFFMESNEPYYTLWKGDELLIDSSRLVLKMKNKPGLDKNFEVVETIKESRENTWTQHWGEVKEITDKHNELKIVLFNDQENYNINIYFRLFDDGLGIRYEIPKQNDSKNIEITEEITEFNIAGDYSAWWIPGDPDSYEFLYNNTKISEIDSVNTPITIQTDNNTFLSIHEAALTNYAGMRLKRNNEHNTLLTSDLIPWPDGIKVKSKLPLLTPWRTIQVGDKAGDLIESDMILNLNDPNKLNNLSYLEPMKYVGIWWGMHIDLNTWEEGPRHGATTEAAKRYIDFASNHNIKGVLIEGWNKGWESWLSGNNAQDYTQHTDDFDIEEVVKYAKEQGVELIGHHETGSNIPMYEKQRGEALKYYKNLGIHTVKTAYGGQMNPEGTYHHGQYMVHHYREVVKLAHQNEIMIDAHEPIKPTGIRRTYPNMMTRGGVRGMEYNAWSDGNPPDHTTILPFTRMLAGPLDYTPGIFDIMLKKHENVRKKHAGKNLNRRVHTTLAKQLGLFVVLYSPLQMAADLIENYEGHPAFKFIEDVPVDWEQTHVLNGEIGDYITIVRKDRNSNEWYLGSITDENKRDLTVSLDFLDENKTYKAEIYKDAKNTHWETNPTEYIIEKATFREEDSLKLELAEGGGTAIRFYPE
ncbi:MAG: glycoside hydrolase family 97 protein [Bacteroidales bacterium]